MIAGILLTRARVNAYLTSLGHTDAGLTMDGATGGYRFWMTPWGHKFTVPDWDHAMPTWALEEIVEAVNRTRPPVH